MLQGQGFFQLFWEKAPGQNWVKMIDLISKLGEINDIEQDKGSKIYPHNQVILDCIMSSIPLKHKCLSIILIWVVVVVSMKSKKNKNIFFLLFLIGKIKHGIGGKKVAIFYWKWGQNLAPKRDGQKISRRGILKALLAAKFLFVFNAAVPFKVVFLHNVAHVSQGKLTVSEL